MIKYLLLALLVFGGDGLLSDDIESSRIPGVGGPAPGRIVSMAPSITEVLFALGLGENVVGVTRFCFFPAEAKKIRKVGGFLNPNYEAILSLRPDRVILLEAHREAKDKLEKLGIDIFVVDHDSVRGILESIKRIGKIMGAQKKSKELLENINGRLARIKEKVKGQALPKVLISANRQIGSGVIRNINAAGKGSFYDDIINLAGGVNAYGDGTIAYPMVSMEGIIFMRPDYIIDIIPTLEKSGLDEKTVAKEWERVAPRELFKKGGVHVFWRDYTVIPGPRFIRIVERIAKIIHPEIRWN